MKIIEEAMIEAWGERCPDQVEGCPTCDAWAEYDITLESIADGMQDSFGLGWDHAITMVYRWVLLHDTALAEDIKKNWGQEYDTQH